MRNGVLEALSVLSLVRDPAWMSPYVPAISCKRYLNIVRLGVHSIRCHPLPQEHGHILPRGLHSVFVVYVAGVLVVLA